MKATIMARLSVLVILLVAQGCDRAGEEAFELLYERMLLASGRKQPAETLDCRLGHDYRVPRGTCARLANPCNRTADGPLDGDWVRGDAFGFDADAPSWLSVHTVSSSTAEPAREICVAPGAPPLISARVSFTYASSTGLEFGQGTLSVTTVAALRVVASATPPDIELGQSAQLDARVSGGLPPYSFVWSEGAFDGGTVFSDTAIANPVVTPTMASTFALDYVVDVTDALGQGGYASTTVSVVGPVRAEATPSTINPGETSRLHVSSLPCGLETFTWTPAQGLSDPSSRSVVAAPLTTTTYEVSVSCPSGAAARASVTVTVNLLASATANPSVIAPGQSAQLQATVQGGTPPYTFAWTPIDSLNASTVADPEATPSATTSYAVSVSDAVGTTTTASATVTATVTSGPVADFNFTFDGIETLYLDASASTGDIVRYEWTFTWEPGEIVTPSPTSTFTANPDTTGTITLIVTDRSGATSTRTRPFP